MKPTVKWRKLTVYTNNESVFYGVALDNERPSSVIVYYQFNILPIYQFTVKVIIGLGSTIRMHCYREFHS